ncbi:MAG: hypothetical protein ACREQ4_02680 [Candidatus Binataceae bacterium]
MLKGDTLRLTVRRALPHGHVVAALWRWVSRLARSCASTMAIRLYNLADPAASDPVRRG